MFQGFPTPDSSDPSASQQVGDGLWAFHTGDNGGTSGGGDRGDFTSFVVRTFRNDPARFARLGHYDWEMRFTGSNDNPGVNGGYAIAAFTTGVAFWVPFELWRIGIGTPDDPSDDLQLIPWIFGDGGDSLYYLSSYGSDAEGTCGPGGCEHSASGADNDPYTDWVYWKIPVDENGDAYSSGTAGYDIFVDSIMADPTMPNWLYAELAVMDRTVLINWNGGVLPPFNQDLPEQGTVFRISTTKTIPIDTNSFVTTPPQILTSGPEGTSIYMMYKLFNKGGNQIDSCYVSLWTDPDLGNAADDMVGCDTLSDIHFCYNASDSESVYGIASPALGFKFIHGPLVPSNGENAQFDGTVIPDFKNIGMNSFHSFFGSWEPLNNLHTYLFMQGLQGRSEGNPYIYNGDTLTYVHSGDPVTGVGDLDCCPNDRRMFATMGPFDFAPGDSQYVLIKMAVGQGTDRLSSITRMKEILNIPYQTPTDINNDKPNQLPLSFALAQNYPNPFNPTTQIKFSIPIRSDVTISVFNVLGQKVTTLLDKELPAGHHAVEWDASEVSTGLYFYKITAGDFVQSKKMMLLK